MLNMIKFLSQWIWLTIMLTGSVLIAEDDDKPFAEARIVLQLSDGDPKIQGSVLDVANNLIKHYGGPEFIDIEIVAFGPGITLLDPKNKNNTRIESLIANDVRFVVCMNTVHTVQRKTGKEVPLIKEAIPVQTGVAHLIKRIQEGFIVIRP